MVDLPIHRPTSKGVAGRFRGVYWRSSPCWGRNFLSRRKSTENFRFWKMESKCKIFVSGTPKGTCLSETMSFDVLID